MDRERRDERQRRYEVIRSATVEGGHWKRSRAAVGGLEGELLGRLRRKSG